jgi:hypothetical protein
LEILRKLSEGLKEWLVYSTFLLAGYYFRRNAPKNYLDPEDECIVNYDKKGKMSCIYIYRPVTEGAHAKFIVIFINCNWVDTRWQWIFYMYTKYEIGYY